MSEAFHVLVNTLEQEPPVLVVETILTVAPSQASEAVGATQANEPPA